MIRSLVGIISSNSIAIDLDAQNVIEAIQNTGITLSSTQILACHELINDLKAYQIWVKKDVLYGMLGGTASAHKFNWKDPRDLDHAFRLQFFGGWTHSVNGALPNGVNAYANPFYNPSLNALQNSHSFSFYSRTNSNGTEVELGGENNRNISLLEIRTGITTYISVNGYVGQFDTITDANSLGYYNANRTSRFNHDLWKNGVKIRTGTMVSSALVNNNYALSALNNLGNVIYFSSKQCAFASIGKGLSDTEAFNDYAAIQKYQTTLNRQV